MNTCSHCRMEVETAAVRCPYCLENPYSGFGGGSITRFVEYVIQAAIIVGIFMWIFG